MPEEQCTNVKSLQSVPVQACRWWCLRKRQTEDMVLNRETNTGGDRKDTGCHSAVGSDWPVHVQSDR
jgi:hypothetical protein